MCRIVFSCIVTHTFVTIPERWLYSTIILLFIDYHYVARLKYIDDVKSFSNGIGIEGQKVRKLSWRSKKHGNSTKVLLENKK